MPDLSRDIDLNGPRISLAQRLRAHVGLVALVTLAIALTVIPDAALGAQRSPWSFGKFVGYVWRGHVESVRASWAVPGVRLGSVGRAGTWIGAQAPGAPEPFIQIGTNEESFHPFPLGSSVTLYYAFWSDTTNHFHPHFLFRVARGDDVSASLALVSGRWRLAIVDKTSGATARFSTDEEARASFNLAEWLQEDVTDAATGKPFPYPRLTDLRFRRLAVNSAMPAYADMYSQWMSASGTNWAPSPLRRDSFALHRATVSSIGAKYLQIAAGEDMDTRVFVHQMAGWTATMPVSQIAAACSTFAAALRKSLYALARTRWPPRAWLHIHSLIRSTRVLLALLQSPPSASPADLRAWTSTWARDSTALGRAAHLIRRAMKIPEITPTQ
jgi:hypothetical protein